MALVFNMPNVPLESRLLSTVERHWVGWGGGPARKRWGKLWTHVHAEMSPESWREDSTQPGGGTRSEWKA